MTPPTREQVAAARAAVIEAYGAALFQGISVVLYEEDPLRLAACGAPTDEYEPEVETILPRLAGCGSAEDVQRVAFEAFERWFGVGHAGRVERYRSVGERVWQLWRDRAG